MSRRFRKWRLAVWRDPAGPTVLLIVGIALVYAGLTAWYAPVWTSELALWERAVRQAPHKPRPALNYGIALVMQGRRAEARAQWERAIQLAQAPHIPVWDRDEITAVATANLQTLDELDAGLRGWSR